MRIPTTSVQTSSRADWLAEFSIALIALAFLAREVIFVVVGAGILLALASRGLLFHRGLEILRRELDVVERLPKARTFLGDNLEGDLTIRNGSRLAARILAVRPVVEEGLSVKLSPSFDQVLRPDTASSSKFEITSLKSGRFRISGFTLAFTDSRGLFTGEVNYEQADWVEVYPSVRTKVPITPLRLYGEGPEVLRKGLTGMDYAGIRQYVPGDEYHRVEWKATARLQTLMVKEFYQETQTTLQILIDTGRTMHQQSYVGAKFDEALAVAQLLVQLGKRVGIWIYNEREIVQTIKPANTEEQLASLRRLALAGRVLSKSEEPASRVPGHPASRRETSNLFGGDRFGMFLRLLRLKLGLGHTKAGVYKATMEATRASPDGLLIVLTDLEGDNEALLEVASVRQKRGGIIVAQMGSAWRLTDNLEEAYAKYQTNRRTLNDLERFGLRVFDLRPEELVDQIGYSVMRSSVGTVAAT